MQDWSQFGAIAWPLLIALALGLLVRRALLVLAAHARARAATHLRARIAQVVAVPAALALPLLFLSIAVTATPLPPEWAGRIQHWLGIGTLLCLTWLLVRAVGAVERRILREHPVDVADNLQARRVQTQTAVISRVIQGAIILVGVALALMTFPAIRQIGATLLASAGIIGLIAGIAAKPVFGNLIAGLQIALAQPIRLDDVVIVEGEWGRIEEITSTYVVVRIWDERRMVVPLQWFIENPFQNWTRSSAELLGTAFLWLDYRTPMDEVRAELQRLCERDSRWDGRVCVAQVTETAETTIQVRLLVSARDSGSLFDLRCAVREGMIDFLAARHPGALPRLRAEVHEPGAGAGAPRRRGSGGETDSPGAEESREADPAAPPAARPS
ncbi:mechanosensitive ion channel family protein [Luteimonas sp. RD2P54]|uniref:Mechanosensitive ion channel family protein n=1 Tax=Luteimonas endophytica TaxID=3042023 RepID=A0ABT6JD87_9GAMM|nr:mechanosensitive ion channel family protein [Luteimonas endophytica]MDH5824790.1 mechanosensitive ion channel family protein [Luteimonas endophytica]